MHNNHAGLIRFFKRYADALEQWHAPEAPESLVEASESSSSSEQDLLKPKIFAG
jgi:hypothetical protein